MKKIPSLFLRDEGNKALVTEVVNPDCAWVLVGEGRPTEKRDGTACLIRDGKLLKRFDAKNGKTPPEGFEPCEPAPMADGHWPGWVPVTQGAEDQWHVEALLKNAELVAQNGTYELIGAKINGNPYGYEQGNYLERHGTRLIEAMQGPTTFEKIKAYLLKTPIEGIVWHHPNGRMAKIKRRDFGFPWP